MSTEKLLEDMLSSFNDEALFSEDETGSVIDRYYAPDFVEVSDGISIDRARLIKHIRPVRKQFTGAVFKVQQALRDGDHISARYTIRATTKTGQVIDTEIFMFADLTPDGRFQRVNQITRTLPAE
ncbi:nuclear transport factor 2 family protein [Streptomyces sp. NPDC048436]|uniref:nuclear transport factor 2 family protein n=1 Tax=Streptomyces sp. NPDC048436 TaxID=3365550 RepID=UPI00371D0780